jgi:hypothetical protein
LPQYRKKPVVIEAWCYTPMGAPSEYFTRMPEWLERAYEDGVVSNVGASAKTAHLKIKTLEGDMVAEQGDWIIRGVKGELYPCKPDIFALTYEPLSG